MKIVITMAGRGQRFRDVGYDCPKYMIEVLDKSLFHWSMLSLVDFFGDEFIFIAREEDSPIEFIQGQCKDIGISNYNIVLLDATTDGQATTVLKAETYIDDIDELIVYNIDTYVIEGAIQRESLIGDGFIPGFIAEGNKWSFIQLNEDGQVIKIAEKKPISNIATLGLYYFKSFDLYKNYYVITFQDGANLVNGEKYIAEMYNVMLSNNKLIYGNILTASSVWGLGTPSDVQYFLDNYGK